MANDVGKRNSKDGGGEVRSILSPDQHEDKGSIDHKVYSNQPVGPGELVTVTVDGFGLIDYGKNKLDNTEESVEEEHHVEEGGGDTLEEEQSLNNAVMDTHENKVAVQRYTFRNRNQMTVQVNTQLDTLNIYS